MSATPPLRAQRPGFPGYLAPDDGFVDENPDNNCNWACYSAAIQALGGPAVPPDHLKDHNRFYGQGTSGPSYDGNNQYEDTTYGLALSVKTLTGAARQADLKTLLASGAYVQILIPSDWNDPVPSSPSSHYVLLYGDTGSGYWAMNPWDGTYMFRDYARWATLDARGSDYLVYTKATSVTAPTPKAPATLGSGFAAYYLAHAMTASVVEGEVTLYPGSTSGETYAGFSDGTVLYYAPAVGVKDAMAPWMVKGLRAALANTAAEAAGQKANAAKATAALADAQTQVSDLQTKLAAASTALTAAQTQEASLSGQVKNLTDQVAALQAQIAALQPSASAAAQAQADLKTAQDENTALTAQLSDMTKQLTDERAASANALQLVTLLKQLLG